MEGGELEDAGVGDDGVDVRDAVGGGEGGDGGLGVGLGGGFDLEEDDFAAGGGGERGECLGFLGVGVADGADDGGVGTREVLFDETLAESCGAKANLFGALEVRTNSCWGGQFSNSPLLAPEIRTTDIMIGMVRSLDLMSCVCCDRGLFSLVFVVLTGNEWASGNL